MRRLSLALFLLAGCDSATGSDPLDLALSALEVIGGNHQEAEVATQVPNPLRISARVGATPAPGLLVCYVADSPQAGEPFTPCVLTDENGEAGAVWTFGTQAGEYVVQARGMVAGEPVAFADYELVARPGPITSAFLHPEYTSNQEVGLPALLPDIFNDTHSNVIGYTIAVTGDFTAVENPTAFTAWGLALADGAEVGASGTITFTATRDGVVVVRHAERVPYVVEGYWRLHLSPLPE